MSGAPLKILFVASECLPFAKAGGLADVVSALSKELTRQGHDARVVMPLYRSVDRRRFGLAPFASVCVHMGGGEEHWAALWWTTLEGEVPVYFLEYDRFFGRAGIYNEASEYPDNAYRFAFLSKAALQLALDLDFVPDVMHLHDWPTALAASYLRQLEPGQEALARTASVLTIHNVQYQGKFGPEALRYIGLGPDAFTPERLEDHGGLNLLKCGIADADKITTVSPTHAQEMMGALGGHGLGSYLARRAADVTGILNGVDDDVWDPETDKLLPARYAPADMRGKLVCKQALQRHYSLDDSPDLPLFGIVSRFAPQKGLDLLREAIPSFLEQGALELVVLGSGDPALEVFFHGLGERYPQHAGSTFGYSEPLAHLIEAGSDFFLMPSLYEPCGLNQMYSMRYGTLPIVRATGGLADTVVDGGIAKGEGTGFVFAEPTPAAVRDAIDRALEAWFFHPAHVAEMRHRAMAMRFPWDRSARETLAVYEAAIARRRGAAAPTEERRQIA